MATHPLREPEYWIGVDTRGWSHGITFTVQTHFSEDSWIIHFCQLHKRLHLVPYPNTYTLTRLQSLWTCAAAVSSLEATGTAGSLWRPSAAPHCIAAGSAPGWGGASEPAPRETRNTQTPPVQTNPQKIKHEQEQRHGKHCITCHKVWLFLHELCYEASLELKAGFWRHIWLQWRTTEDASRQVLIRLCSNPPYKGYTN